MTRTTIELDSQTRDRLKKAGRMDETYDVFINRILDERETREKKIS
jgi:hypothetical protein